MPTDLNDVDTSGVELWFSDDMEGETFYLRDSAVFEAGEVREETGTDIPEFGRWFPVHGATEDGETTGETGWLVALGELVEELQTMTPDPVETPWTVTRCQKSGPKQTDSYEVNVENHADLDPDQQGLGEN